MSLTTVQNKIFQFIRRHFENRGVAPSTSEICKAFGFKSFGTVARHMKRLEEKGYIKRAGRRNKQGVLLADRPSAVNIPLVGTVSAGLPIEAIEGKGEKVAIPETLLSKGEHFALKVKGNSMVEDGIYNGDYIIVRKQERADDGQTIVALLDNEATVKNFYKYRDKIELRPANISMDPLFISGSRLRDFQIQGIVVGLFRRFS